MHLNIPTTPFSLQSSGISMAGIRFLTTSYRPPSPFFAVIMARIRQPAHLLADEVQLITSRPRLPHRRASTETLGRSDEEPEDIIDLSDDDVIDDIIDLTVDDSHIQERPLSDGAYAIASVRASSELIVPGKFIEVHSMTIFNYIINFILVKTIIRDRQGKTVIRGVPFTRNKNLTKDKALSSKLPKKLNEVCEILAIDQQGSPDSPALVEAPIEAFVKVRKLTKTNVMWQPYSHDQFDGIRDPKERDRAIEALGMLFCRWQFTIVFVTQRNAMKPVEEILRRFHENEVEPACRVRDEKTRADWRGDEKASGSRTPTYLPGGDHKYNLFDSFSGAGGVSRGAQMAGFRVSHAIDSEPQVWPTYEANFPNAKLFRGSVNEYIQSRPRGARADVLHLSPPCQYFSPAHTHDSPHDEANIDSLFSCLTLVREVRPRLITVEETFGLTHDRHLKYLQLLINDFTQIGYSVRWKVVRLCTWGSAQDRKRLIMIGAAPGEQLPPFPRATHSEYGLHGTKKFHTMRQALAGIRPGDSLHDINAVKEYIPAKRAYDPNRLAGTLTTSGADFCYPDGTRDFTLREFAALQGFPRCHKFEGTRTSIKRQIGNAFPPNTVKVLYEHLKTWLYKQDGVTPSPNNDVIMLDGPSLEAKDFIIVDDSDDDSVREVEFGRGFSVESHSDSEASVMRDIQDVRDLDDDDDVIMIDLQDKTIDLTRL